MKKYSFRSSNGFNSQLELGRIYIFSTNQTLKYLLEVNKDLIVNSFIIKNFFINHVYKYPTRYKFFKKYKLPQDLYFREVGLLKFII